MNSTFREMTFDFGDVLSRKITQHINSEDETGPNETTQNVTIELTEVYSEFGQCYSYYSDEKISMNSNWKFKFKNNL
jgi:hypothetical protein